MGVRRLKGTRMQRHVRFVPSKGTQGGGLNGKGVGAPLWRFRVSGLGFRSPMRRLSKVFGIMPIMK